MPYPHVIRLRGPWDYQPLMRWRQLAGQDWTSEAANLPPPGKAKLPGDWGGTLGAAFRGRVRFTRHFNRPTGLETRERVWLIVEGADARCDVQLNGRALGEVRGYALTAGYDITTMIESRNELAIDVELPPAGARGAPPRSGREQKPGGLIGEVRLEIRGPAWLDELCLYALPGEPRPRIHLSGAVEGDPASGPFSLLVAVERRELHFGPAAAGQGIEIAKEVENLPIWIPGQPNALGAVDVSLLKRGEVIWEASRRTAVLNIAAATGKVAHVLNEIASDEQYTAFDAAGQPIVQHVPIAWAESVCRRLAHHPSIVAWAAPQAELRRMEPSGRPLWYGRPWDTGNDT
jgi:hypothetical protein